MDKPEYHVVNFSGGKDSTALLERKIERGEQIDEVICADTTMEFPAMQRHIEKVKQRVEDAGIKFTILRADHDFEYYLLNYQPKRKNPKYEGLLGKSWAGPRTRWCTKMLKTDIQGRYLRSLKERYTVISYIGIAADEQHRLERKQQQGADMQFPLVEWGWTEADALAYCYGKGYDWEGLYEIFDRVSCWCCPLQSLEALRKLRKHFPELWRDLEDLDEKTWRDFKDNGQSVRNLGLRFDLETELTKAGHSIKDQRFFADLRRLYADEITIDGIISERAKK